MKKVTLFVLIGLLVFTLPFKFGIIGADRAYAFPKIVPIGIGLVELCAALLLAFLKTRRWGAVLAICIFAGAVLAHVFVLGIGYGKVLFPLALLGLVLAVTVFRSTKKQMDFVSMNL